MASSAPDLHIPSSTATVDISIINTTGHIDGIPTTGFVVPKIAGHNYLRCPVFSFLIQHSSGRKILFDLGVRKDWENFAPAMYSKLKSYGWNISVQKDVREILESENISPNRIHGIIWSHYHWDHTGDPSQFPGSTELIVGPGFKENFMPGYPENKDATIRVSDYEGRDVREINFDEKPLRIGGFPAFDFFGDGSFYLLDAPGHTVAHICGLARTTAGPDGDTFILMGGDFSHHGGEFRPSPYLPLPTTIFPNSFNFKGHAGMSCPGDIFEKIHPATKLQSKGASGDGDDTWKTQPFYQPGESVTHNIQDCVNTIHKVQGADALDHIFVAFAHDDTLLNTVEFFPEKANNWKKKDWAKKAKWRFLADFQEALDSAN